MLLHSASRQLTRRFEERTRDRELTSSQWRLLVLLNFVIKPALTPEASQDFRRELLREVLPLLEEMPFERVTSLRLLMQLYAVGLGWQLVGSEETACPSVSPLFVQEAQASLTVENEFPVACRAIFQALAQDAQPVR